MAAFTILLHRVGNTKIRSGTPGRLTGNFTWIHSVIMITKKTVRGNPDGTFCQQLYPRPERFYYLFTHTYFIFAPSEK